MLYTLKHGISLVSRIITSTKVLHNITRNMTGHQITLKSVVSKLEEFAPLTLSEKWDNTGLLIEPYTPRFISKILLTNDLTEDVMSEAVREQAEMIVTYHPLIFSSMKTIVQSKWKERVVSRCLEERIAVYSPHTSWDAVNKGVNDWLASCLPPHDRKIVIEGTVPGTGMGRLCVFKEVHILKDVVETFKNNINLEHVQLALAREHSEESKISTVALCAGSGASVLRGVKADLFITGEMGHHEILDAVHCGTSVILTNHSNSERRFLQDFRDVLYSMLPGIKVVVSSEDEDPLKFH